MTPSVRPYRPRVTLDLIRAATEVRTAIEAVNAAATEFEAINGADTHRWRSFAETVLEPAEERLHAAERALIDLMDRIGLPAFVVNNRLYLDTARGVEIKASDCLNRLASVDVDCIASLD